MSDSCGCRFVDGLVASLPFIEVCGEHWTWTQQHDFTNLGIWPKGMLDALDELVDSSAAPERTNVKRALENMRASIT